MVVCVERFVCGGGQLCFLRHGSGDCQRFNPAKEAGSGAAYRPALHPQEEEKPQQE